MLFTPRWQTGNNNNNRKRHKTKKKEKKTAKIFYNFFYWMLLMKFYCIYTRSFEIELAFFGYDSVDCCPTKYYNKPFSVNKPIARRHPTLPHTMVLCCGQCSSHCIYSILAELLNRVDAQLFFASSLPFVGYYY